MRSIPFYLTLVLVLTVAVSAGSTQGEALGSVRSATQLEGAVEETHAVEDEAHAEEGWSSVAFRWVNVLILFGGLGYLLRGPAAEFFKARSSAIEGGLAQAQTAQLEADRRLDDIDMRLSQISTEVSRIRSEADRSSSRERGRIVADARAEAERAVAQSSAEVDRIAQGMEREVRAEAADLLILRAEEQLRGKMTEADRVRTFRKAIDRL